jgi:hypothetical protein
LKSAWVKLHRIDRLEYDVGQAESVVMLTIPGDEAERVNRGGTLKDIHLGPPTGEEARHSGLVVGRLEATR